MSKKLLLVFLLVVGFSTLYAQRDYKDYGFRERRWRLKELKYFDESDMSIGTDSALIIKQEMLNFADGITLRNKRLSWWGMGIGIVGTVAACFGTGGSAAVGASGLAAAAIGFTMYGIGQLNDTDKQLRDKSRLIFANMSSHPVELAFDDCTMGIGGCVFSDKEGHTAAFGPSLVLRF